MSASDLPKTKGAGVEPKKAQPSDAGQLHFTFFTETQEDPEEERNADIVSSESGLEQTVMQARDALLDASLSEVDRHLPLLFEFCEAALTRALDTAQKRHGVSFSEDEYRSLRGIGQAHWLLVERHSREE